MINVLLPFKSLHPNKIVWLEPILINRLPVIVSPALDTFKASRSSTYFLVVKCLSLAGTVSLFVVASVVSSTAWDQLTPRLRHIWEDSLWVIPLPIYYY